MIETGPPTVDEIRKALKETKSGKAPGVDNITAEILKTDMETTKNYILCSIKSGQLQRHQTIGEEG